MLCKEVLPFESVDEILECDYSNVVNVSYLRHTRFLLWCWLFGLSLTPSLVSFLVDSLVLKWLIPLSVFLINRLIGV